MARLPIPGSDDNVWGSVLNDYLSQAIASDGSLKSGSVGANQIQAGVISEAKLDSAAQTKLNSPGDPALGGALTGTASNAQIATGAVGTAALASNSVTTAKLADGSVTSSKLAGGASAADGLRSLLIYYAPPSVINGKFQNDYAAGVLSRYDDVVLGTGLEDPASPYYADTTAIIQKVAALSDTVIWGYIDAGVTTGNLPLSTIQTQVDQWVAIGAGGIFLDVIGYDYGVSRSRQNAIIDYVHSKGIGSILNAFNPDDIFSPAINATYNPTGLATTANSSDVILLESWVCNSDAYSSPFYTTFSDIKTRGDAARAYRNSLGVRIFAVNIIGHTGRTENELNEYRAMSEALARIWRLDASGIAASTYSSTGSDVGVVAPRFKQLRTNPLRPTAPYVLNGAWTEVEAPDLGILVHFETGTHTWQQL